MAKANNNKLYITISDKRLGEGADGTSKGGSQQNGSASKQSNIQDYMKHEFFNMIKSQGVKAYNSSVAMYGNLTGDYYTQMKMEDAMNVASSLVNLGLGAVNGLTMSGGNPLGAVVGAGIVVVGEGINWMYNRINLEASMNKTNREIELLRNRSGLNSLKDGGRGTEE